LRKEVNFVAAASMHGKRCLVTGATSGIGFITAQALAQQGAAVVLVGRDPNRGAAAVERITHETGNDAVSLLLADLSSQSQIVQAAQEFHDHFDRLDILVNNAGALFAKRQLSVDGIEMTFALNHLGYFLLTHLLLDTIKASPYARIVNVASGAHRAGHIDFDDLQGERRYGGWRAYCQSKLANILFTYELAARLRGTGVTANVMHPGFVATNFGHNNSGLFAWLIRITQVAALSPQQGAETIIHLATSPDVAGHTGRYFIKKRAVPSSKESYDKSIANRLWQISEDMVGLSSSRRR
jgi:NAD(P)-dependent dehydrogenase (short-subunit alcohol dehydrogenase family)